jgi:hypothetical protein
LFVITAADRHWVFVGGKRRSGMILKTHIPRFPLAQFVDHFIYYEGYNPEHSIDRFLPDGNTEIIIDFSDGPQYIYDNQTLKEIQACHNVWAS